VGQVADLGLTAISVEFNDIAGVEAALATGEVAAILTEPVMTNSCMVLPQPGFHEALRSLATPPRRAADHRRDAYHFDRAGRLYPRARAQPDIFVAGKCVAGGMPTAVWGLCPRIWRQRFAAYNETRAPGPFRHGHHPVGQPDAVRLPARHPVQGDDGQNYAHMEKGAARLEAGLAKAIARHMAALACGARRRAGGVHLRPRPAAQRGRGDAAHQPQVESPCPHHAC
jgi:glutamate-1-semialdehyde 2,1-aminomutase